MEENELEELEEEDELASGKDNTQVSKKTLSDDLSFDEDHLKVNALSSSIKSPEIDSHQSLQKSVSSDISPRYSSDFESQVTVIATKERPDFIKNNIM